MANNNLLLAFEFQPTAQEAELLDECYRLVQDLPDLDDEELVERYQGTSDAFKAAFPSPGPKFAFPDNVGRGEIGPEHCHLEMGNPFSSFLELFPTSECPSFGAETFRVVKETGEFLIAGSEADPDSIAGVLQKCAPGILPFAFEWARTCSSLRPGEFGGGYYVITADEIICRSSHRLMKAELDALTATGQ